MAATGLTVNGQCVRSAMLWLVINTAMLVYQAPQTKNWRNIMVLSLKLVELFDDIVLL